MLRVVVICIALVGIALPAPSYHDTDRDRVEPTVSSRQSEPFRPRVHVKRPDLNCKIRSLAADFASKLVDDPLGLAEILRALNDSGCISFTPRPPPKAHPPDHYEETLTYFVDQRVGDDAREGSDEYSPVRTIQTAIQRCRSRPGRHRHCRVKLSPSAHFLVRPIELTSEDSGLIVEGSGVGKTVLSGGKVLQTRWTSRSGPRLYKYSGCSADFDDGSRADSDDGPVLKKVSCVEECFAICNETRECTAYTFYKHVHVCSMRTDGQWYPRINETADCGKKVSIFVADLKGQEFEDFSSLFVDDRRLPRARCPNGNVETTGLHTYPSGHFDAALSWLLPVPVEPAFEIHIDNPTRTRTPFDHFQLGLGGPAKVFNPQASFWAVHDRPYGYHFQVPSGLSFNFSTHLVNDNWTHAEEGVVHAYQDSHWGGWIFQLDTRDGSTLKWSKGGFQEARGSTSGREFYVENIYEELDAQDEWYYDKRSKNLFLSSFKTDLPDQVVVSQLKDLITIKGDQQNPVHNVAIRNMTLAHSAITYLDDYMVPSGGDWTIHLGGMIHATGTEFLDISRIHFQSPEGNGLVLSGYHRNATVSSNHFSMLGENGISLVGFTSLIDGTGGDQPRGTSIVSNVIHDIGLWGKQSYGIVQSVAGETFMAENVIFNSARGGININDGFGGGNIIHANLLFDLVRETDDHGPINTWDRQPYLYNKDLLTLLPKLNTISQNMIINTYRSSWPIDHDDGSAYWDDHHNVMVYGGFKNYLGHDLSSHHNIYVFPDGYTHSQASVVVPYCLDTVGQSLGPTGSGSAEMYFENTCFLGHTSLYRLGSCDPSHSYDLVPYTHHNRFFTPNGTTLIQCGGNSYTLEQYQSQLLLDLFSSASPIPDDDVIIRSCKDMLQL